MVQLYDTTHPLKYKTNKGETMSSISSIYTSGANHSNHSEQFTQAAESNVESPSQIVQSSNLNDIPKPMLIEGYDLWEKICSQFSKDSVNSGSDEQLFKKLTLNTKCSVLFHAVINCPELAQNLWKYIDKRELKYFMMSRQGLDVFLEKTRNRAAPNARFFQIIQFFLNNDCERMSYDFMTFLQKGDLTLEEIKNALKIAMNTKSFEFIRLTLFALCNNLNAPAFENVVWKRTTSGPEENYVKKWNRDNVKNIISETIQADKIESYLLAVVAQLLAWDGNANKYS